MRWSVLISCMVLLNCSSAVVETDRLHLEKTIPLPGVTGRIDHLAIDLQHQTVFIAALGNNTIEVVDLRKGIVIQSIKNLHEPQGIIYLPGSNSIFVANGDNGVGYVFNATDFSLTHSIQLPGDADNVRYDSAENKIYVGYGSGGIALIDANTFQETGDIKLSGHPESFQLDKSESKIYVNVPDEHEVDMIDLKTSMVGAHWHPQARSNFPMAIDETNHRVFIGCRNPAKLEVLDSRSGKNIASLDCARDADDIFFNREKKEIYVSCGAGYLDVFKQNDADHYEFEGRTSTRSGARTSLFIPDLNQLIVAAPASLSLSASLFVYSIK